MPRLYFGTDGVRGPYGGPVINEAFAARLGQAAAAWAKGKGLSGRILIGRDTRASGPALTDAVAAGIAAAGLVPVDVGILPTPALARAVRTTQAALGVVITASHNPASDNGIKFFQGDGTKLSDADETAIEGLLPAQPAAATAPAREPDHFEVEYIEAITKLLPKGCLKGWTVAMDTANGATARTSPEVFRRLGAEVKGIGDAPNGTNINAGVGSEHPEKLCELAVYAGARIGVAHDGDGDRCVLCDETGHVLDGDEILAILAIHALAHHTLKDRTLVVTLQSNGGLDAAFAAAGGKTVRTQIGDRYVAEKMRSGGYLLGGESSGHIVCADVSPTGDGLIAAVKVVQVMIETGKPLSDLRKILVKFPQKTAGLTVREKRPVSELPTLSAEMASLQQEFGSRGRLLVRYSGTEPLLRFLVEAPDEAQVDRGLARLMAAANQDLFPAS